MSCSLLITNSLAKKLRAKYTYVKDAKVLAQIKKRLQRIFTVKPGKFLQI